MASKSTPSATPTPVPAEAPAESPLALVESAPSEDVLGSSEVLPEVAEAVECVAMEELIEVVFAALVLVTKTIVVPCEVDEVMSNSEL
jgi:hypothetical protein